MLVYQRVDLQTDAFGKGFVLWTVGAFKIFCMCVCVCPPAILEAMNQPRGVCHLKKSGWKETFPFEFALFWRDMLVFGGVRPPPPSNWQMKLKMSNHPGGDEPASWVGGG